METLLQKSYYLSLLFAISCCLTSNSASFAQVPGVFLPSVYGDTATAPLPSAVEVPGNLPFLQRKLMQLDQDLKESHRPYIGNIFAYANEPLDNKNGRFDTVTEGLQAGFFLNRQTQMQFDFLPTVGGLSNPRINMTQYRLTLRSQPTNRLRLLGSVGLVHTFKNVRPGVAVVGGGGFNYALNDRVRVGASYLRDIVGDSRLSATGLNLPGTNFLVGRVKRNKWTVGTNVRVTPRTDIDFRYSLGVDVGHHMKRNPFQEFSLRVGHSLIAREPRAHIQLLQPSFQFLATGFKYDLSGFGNTTLIPSNDVYANFFTFNQAYGLVAQPYVSPIEPRQAGVGGYFSPQQFYLCQGRVDMAGRIAGKVFYRAGGGLGTQNFKNTSQSLGQTGLVGSCNAAIIYRLGKHVSVETGWYFLQAANQYQRNVIYNESRYYF